MVLSFTLTELFITNEFKARVLFGMLLPGTGCECVVCHDFPVVGPFVIANQQRFLGRQGTRQGDYDFHAGSEHGLSRGSEQRRARFNPIIENRHDRCDVADWGRCGDGPGQ